MHVTRTHVARSHVARSHVAGTHVARTHVARRRVAHMRARAHTRAHRHAYTRVKLTFPHDVHVSNVYDATKVNSLTTSNSVTLELGPMPTKTREVAIMGSSTAGQSQVDLDDITILCTPVSGPPPAPPHADDCPLLKRYKTTAAWSSGQIAALRMKQWESGRKVTLTYYGQRITVTSPQEATLTDSKQESGNTIVHMTLGEQPAGTAGSEEEGFELFYDIGTCDSCQSSPVEMHACCA